MFIHRLALALSKTVDDLLATLSVAELKAWQQFDRQVGLPDIASQWQRGVAISVACAAAGGKSEASDYVPLLSWDKQPMTAKQIVGVMRNG